MKKYRLKKDTPTIKAGTIFQEVTSDYDKSRELVRIMPTSGTTSPQWTIDDIINFDEWFEEVKEFKEWTPEEGEACKHISSFGVVHAKAFAAGDTIDEFRLSVGNFYPMSTPDEVIVKEQKLIPQAMHRLKMAAKKAWFEFDGSEGVDWNKCRSCHWRHFICFDRETYRFYVNGDDYQQIAGVVYFPTEESARTYIDNNLDDLKLLFGVE